MGLEEAKEPGALEEPQKQRPIVSRQPAIERAVAPAFERMQQLQGHDFAGPQGGVGMFRDAMRSAIYLAEQGDTPYTPRVLADRQVVALHAIRIRLYRR